MMLVNKTVLRKDTPDTQIKLLHAQVLPIYLRRLSENLLRAE